MIIEFMIMNEEASRLSAISVLNVDHSKQSFRHSQAHRATFSAFGQRRNVDVSQEKKLVEKSVKNNQEISYVQKHTQNVWVYIIPFRWCWLPFDARK